MNALKYPPYSEDFYPENFDDTLHDTTSHEGEIEEAVRSMYEFFVAFECSSGSHPPVC